MVDPPLLAGAVQLTWAWPSPAVAMTLVTMPGLAAPTVIGMPLALRASTAATKADPSGSALTDLLIETSSLDRPELATSANRSVNQQATAPTGSSQVETGVLGGAARPPRPLEVRFRLLAAVEHRLADAGEEEAADPVVGGRGRADGLELRGMGRGSLGVANQAVGVQG